MTRSAPRPHWTRLVYRGHAELFYDVEAALFRNRPLTRQELAVVAEVARLLGAEIASPVVDLACGPGRHSLELARMGHAVTGVDFSETFLRMASRAAAAAPAPPPRFVCGDLRSLQFADGSFRTALLLGNSFGYFSDEENERILREARRVLRPGGLLCLEVTHRDAYLSGLMPYEEEIVEGRTFERLRCEWWKRWDPVSGRVHTHERHSLADSGEVLYEGPYDLRLYDPSELEGILRTAGLERLASRPLTPSTATLEGGLGETFGAMGELLFVGTVR